MSTLEDRLPSPPETSVRPLVAEDETEVVALLRVALGGGPTGSFDQAFFDWKHRRSPFGRSPGLVATHEDRVVGVRLFMRWQLRGPSGTVRAVRAVDTATDPMFRGRGIFRRLTLELLDQLHQDQQADVVFNTPNSSSRPGYLKMGWQEVATLPVRLTPIRPVRLVRGARAAIATTAGAGGGASTSDVPAWSRPACPFDSAADVLEKRQDEVEDLLLEARQSQSLHTPLDVPYLVWRYAEAPDLDYRSIMIERGGRLAGLAFGRLRQRGPLNEFTLADVLVRDGDRSTARRLLSRARRSGADHVAVHTARGTEIDEVAARGGYLRVLRHGVGLVAKPLRVVRPDPTRPSSWTLSLGDLEVF